MADTITYFAQTDARSKRVPFGIKSKDRTKHVYVIGKTGMGKSTLLENMAVQDIKNGEGFALIDPHGKTAELLLEYIPEERIKDVIYFAPFDTDHPISFNVMEDVGYDKRHLVVSGLMSAFKKIWLDAWSARMEYILSNTLLALLEYPDSTLLSVNRMLTDKEYRKRVVDNIKDPSVKSFWVDEFAKYTDRYTQEATPAIQNKVGQFTANPLIRNIIGQPKSSFDFRKLMDERKILIINLSKGRIGEGNANLLGSMLITKIYLAAMSRADVHDREMQKLPNFYLYVDEFQSFANESFADILSEARKYKLNLTIAHQYVEQMSEEVRAAVFGNVGTMIMFRVGAFDAETLEKEFAPAFTAEDMVNLGIYQIYLKLMIDGVASHPFSATTLPPILLPEKSSREQVMENSRKSFSQLRPEVEEAIRVWYQPIIPVKPVTLAKSPSATPVPDLPATTSTVQAGEPKDREKSHPALKPSHTSLEDHAPQEWSKKTEPKKPTPISLDSLKTKSPGLISQGKQPVAPSKNVSGLKEALKEVMGGIKKHEAKPVPPTASKVTPQTARPSAEAPRQQPTASHDEQKQNEIPEDELRKMLHVDK
ncbi:MAG: type IV secretion system DNA-binding domain-containing protein [Candidatus Yonathbacteria bacterium]|nr:type IV secretion system DNA-binding domain-containing protein [Candidatus Yonathbacteria bacterium]